MLTSSEHKRVAVERAVAENYLLDPNEPEHIARVESLPAHPIWQAALWIDCRDDRDELIRRVEAAGWQWLGGCMISPHNALVITSPRYGFSYLFQRCQGPRGRRVLAGPLAMVIEGGREVGPNQVRCLEVLEPFPDDMLEES